MTEAKPRTDARATREQPRRPEPWTPDDVPEADAAEQHTASTDVSEDEDDFDDEPEPVDEERVVSGDEDEYR